MTSKERILLALEHKEADRIPMMDNFWSTTIQRWQQEGLPEGESPSGYFGFDGMSSIGVDISFQVSGGKGWHESHRTEKALWRETGIHGRYRRAGNG